MNTETVCIDYDEEIRETEAATLYRIDDREVWIPKSQIEQDFLHTGGGGHIEIPVWLAEKKELV
jgi:hypothetical protein